MMMPPELLSAIEREVFAHSLAALGAATEELSKRYRMRNNTSFMETDLHRAAYINMRMPATYAAIHAVLVEIQKRTLDFKPASLLDLGAGPGTAMWAASALYPFLQKITLLEQDAGLIALGQKLAGNTVSLSNASWIRKNITQDFAEDKHDLVVASYALGELGDAAMIKTARAAWERTNRFVVIIEPGTQKGYADILKMRDELIALGAHIVAPCPHALTCSMVANPLTPDDWCHFAARLQRSSWHRQAKSAALGYEDEKFSYIVAARQPAENFPARIVRRPLQKSGHTILDLCTAEQKIVRQTVSRRDKDHYRAARKAEWGDAWEEG